jgi:hypothetical protein
MPANSRMTVPMNGSVLMSKLGARADTENGICGVPPPAIQAAPRAMMRKPGTSVPAMTPIVLK